jgi:hypothetical protein
MQHELDNVAVAQCAIGTLEVTGLPAIRFLTQGGRSHDFCFPTIADLARLGETITRHAAQLAAIADAAARPN